MLPPQCEKQNTHAKNVETTSEFYHLLAGELNVKLAVNFLK